MEKDKITNSIELGSINLEDGTIKVNTRQEAIAVLDAFNQIPCPTFLAVPTEVSKLCSPEACLLYGHFLGFNGYYGSNVTLSKSLNCSTRTIIRLLKELTEKGCIKVVYASKSIRYIYPVYSIPYILNVGAEPRLPRKNSKKLDNESENGGFQELE